MVLRSRLFLGARGLRSAPVVLGHLWDPCVPSVRVSLGLHPGPVSLVSRVLLGFLLCPVVLGALYCLCLL